MYVSDTMGVFLVRAGQLGETWMYIRVLARDHFVLQLCQVRSYGRSSAQIYQITKADPTHVCIPLAVLGICMVMPLPAPTPH